MHFSSYKRIQFILPNIKSVFIIDVAESPNPYVDCFICYTIHIKRLVYDFTTPQGDRKDVMVHKTILYMHRLQYAMIDLKKACSLHSPNVRLTKVDAKVKLGSVNVSHVKTS